MTAILLRSVYVSCALFSSTSFLGSYVTASTTVSKHRGSRMNENRQRRRFGQMSPSLPSAVIFGEPQNSINAKMDFFALL